MASIERTYHSWQLVSGSGEQEPKYLDYTGLVPALVGAVKELARQVAELRQR